MKVCHGAIVGNVINYVYAKFSDDWLWNKKALADRKSDNPKKKNNVRDACGSVCGSKSRNTTVVVVDYQCGS